MTVMVNSIRHIATFALLITTLVCSADEGKSFSKQMNEIKRSGEYIYAEASAPTETEAKSACDELLKIEITKYLTAVSPSEADTRIVKSINEYSREYLTQTRGDLIRIFGYIAKNGISFAENNKETKVQSSPEEVKQETLPTQKREILDSKINNQPTQSVPQATSIMLKTEGLQLAKWQIEMLESIVEKSDLIQAKKLLNRYKSQNRIKRLGDKSIANPRPADSYYLIYDSVNKLIALLAPSSVNSHYDMITGVTVDLTNYNDSQFYWFQISQ